MSYSIELVNEVFEIDLTQVGAAGRGITSQVWDADTGVLTVTYTDGGTDTFTAPGEVLEAAQLAKTGAETAQTGAETAEDNAAGSATAAAASATEAQGYVSAVPMNAAYIATAIAAQPLLAGAIFHADFANQAYAIGDRSGLKTTTSFAGLFDVVRPTVRTGFDAAGDLVTFAANAPRFIHDPFTGARKGLAVGPAITNLQHYSTSANSTLRTEYGQARMTIAGGFVKHGLPFVRYVPDTTSGEHYVDAFETKPTGAGVWTCQYTFTDCDFENMAIRPIRSGHLAGPLSPTLIFDISEEAFVENVNSAAMIDYGFEKLSEGTYTLWCTFDTDANATSIFFRAQPNIGGSNTFTGDGVASVAVTGFQIVPGYYRGSLIVTQDAPLTHSADLVEVKPAVVAALWNDEEWTVVLDFVPYVTGQTVALFYLEGAVPGANRVQAVLNPAGLIGAASTVDSVTDLINLNVATVTFGQRSKYALSYKNGRYSACLNGGAVAEVTGRLQPSVGAGFSLMKSHIDTQPAAAEGKALTSYPRGMSDAELQSVTT